MRTAIRSVLLAGFAALGLWSRAAAQSVTARVGGDLTGLPGTTVTIPITVDMSASGGAKLGSYTARLSWDTTALSFCTYCSADSLRGNFPAPQVNTDSASLGVLRLTAIAPLGVDGLVTVAQLPFSTGVDTSATPLQLSFSEMSAAGTFTSLLPLLTVAGATFCPAQGRWGDVDGDAVSGSRDALMVLSSVVGIPLGGQVNVSLGDVDADGKVTSRDALIILSYAVGIPVAGERVLLLAPGTCGTGSAKQLAVFPSAASLVVNQTLGLTAQAVDTAGRAVSAAGVSWSSSDYGVAGVDASGIVTPRSPGTATITATFGPGVQASATITVLARRLNWYVDLQATGAPLELGDAAHPFEHPSQAYALASEGDTIRVASGTYLFTDDGALNAGVVILGGTPGDTTTRPTFVDQSNGYTALWLEGGARTLVRNVTFQNFYYAVDLSGARSLALEDVKILLPAGSYGYGIYSCVNTTVDSVRVERTTLLGDSATQSGYAMYYGGCGPTTLTQVTDSKIRFWGDGLYLSEADSVDIIGSAISDNDGYGIYLGVGDPVYPALHVAHSRIERNWYEAIYGYDYRRLVVDSSVIRSTEDDGIDVEGYGSGRLMELYLHADSIYMEEYANDYDWLYADYADSVVIDRSVIRFPADTADFYTYGDVYADNVSVTNTRFLNLSGAYDLLYFDGRRFFADSVTMTGCNVAGCDQAYGFDVYTSGAGASVTIQRSQFSQLYEPIYVDASNGPVYVQNVAIDSAYYGIELYGSDTVAALDNVLNRIVSEGIFLGVGEATPRRGTSVARDSVTCAPALEGGGAGIYLADRRFVARDNVVEGCYDAIEASSVLSGTALVHNTLRGSGSGIYAYQYDTVAVRIDSNAISTSTSAAVEMYTYGPALLTGNNIQNNSGYGLYLPYSTGYTHQVHGNAFVGNAVYAIYSSGDSVDAINNWWGTSAGPGGGIADSVSSTRIATNPWLTSPPAGLPSLAPPALLASRAAVAGPRPRTAIRGQAPAHQAHAAKSRPRAMPAIVPHPGISPQRLAREREIEQRRATQATRDATRREQQRAQREVQRAQRQSRRPTTEKPQQ
jgi:hypothetical protein